MHLDGNAIAGLLVEALGTEMTDAPRGCQSCGAVNPVVHSTASARTSSPPASSTAPDSTLVISTPARTSTPTKDLVTTV